MMSRPALVSIGMPVCNCLATLPLAVRSIRRQTYTDWELILIDDGSEDGTREFVLACPASDGRIRAFAAGRHLGLSYRLNQAIALSRGPFFARMDGDDVSYPERLERQLDYLCRHPEVDLVGAGAIVFDSHGVAFGKRFGAERHEEICAWPYAGVPVMHPTFLGRIAFFRRYGYAIDSVLEKDWNEFSRTFPGGLPAVRSGRRVAEDQDLLMRAHRNSRFANLPEILLGYREPRLKLAKLAQGRLDFLKSLSQNLRDDKRKLAFYTMVQLAKLSLDGVAIATGLGYTVLRHRARPVADEERARWESVWDGLGGGDPR